MMMRKFAGLSFLLAAVGALAGCGGDNAFGGGSSSSSSGGSTAATITLVSNTSSIFSDGSDSATLTAYVRDSSNAFVAGVPISFVADSGGLTVTQAVTDSNGVATATLVAAGDPSTRNITVTASSGSLNATANVGVTGSTLTLQGTSALTTGQTVTYTVTLQDYGHHPVVSKTVTVTPSGAFVTVSSTSVTTNSSGVATFTVTGNTSGSGTVTVASIGLTTPQSVSVNGSSNLTITAPASTVTEVNINTVTTVTAHYVETGSPVSGRTVNFSTTRGTLSAASATTDGSGDATITITSTNAGSASIIATEATSGATITRSVEFVATTAASLDLQASLFTISPNASSTMTATVRDAAGNLVKNKTVTFALNDVSGGSLSLGSGVTNSQGQAQTVYTAGTGTSANNGVHVTATVQGTAITDNVDLTVAGQQMFISLGTGNKIADSIDHPTTQYQKDYIVQVTDSTGAGVANVPMSFKVLSDYYYKGFWDNTGSAWDQTPKYRCVDEDTNHDGQLSAAEDAAGNGNHTIEAGNVATVFAQSSTTDSKGFIAISVYYPKDHAFWVDVTLSALTSVSGTEYSKSTSFQLVGSSTDFNVATDVAIPGEISPYGIASDCSDPN